MISSKRKVWVPFVCITSDLNTPPSIQMPAARRQVEDNANNTKEITLAKEYYHPHHEEEKGEETRNHSFTSHGNLPASRLQNLFQTFFGELFWEFVCERGNSQSLLFPFGSRATSKASRLTQKSDDNKKLVKRQIYYKTRKLAAGSGQCDEGQSCFAIFHFLGNICEYDCFRLNLWKHTNYSFYDCLFTECPRTQINVMAYCHIVINSSGTYQMHSNNANIFCMFLPLHTCRFSN